MTSDSGSEKSLAAVDAVDELVYLLRVLSAETRPRLNGSNQRVHHDALVVCEAVVARDCNISVSHGLMSLSRRARESYSLLPTGMWSRPDPSAPMWAVQSARPESTSAFASRRRAFGLP